MNKRHKSKKEFDYKKIQRVIEYAKKNIEIISDPHQCIKAVKEGRYVTTKYHGLKIISQDAFNGLNQIANDIYDSNLKFTIDKQNILNSIKQYLSIAIEESQETEINLIEYIYKSCIFNRKYFIPCYLPGHKYIKKFNIGPVIFHNTDAFKLKNIEDKYKKEDVEIISDAISDFNWIAEIYIEGMSDEKGKDRAIELVNIAISALHMSMTHRDTENFGTIFTSKPPERYAYIYQESNKGTFSFENNKRLSTDSALAINLLGKNSKMKCITVGNFLRHHHSKGNLGYMGGRITSAINWYFVSHSHIPAPNKIICYMNCLEALFVLDGTSKKEQISQKIEVIFKGHEDKEIISDHFINTYKIRSELVHGDKSPLKENNYHNVDINLMKFLTEESIIFSIIFWTYLFEKFKTNDQAIDNVIISKKKMKSAYDENIDNFMGYFG